jgi:starch phosphorylase
MSATKRPPSRKSDTSTPSAGQAEPRAAKPKRSGGKKKNEPTTEALRPSPTAASTAAPIVADIALPNDANHVNDVASPPDSAAPAMLSGFEPVAPPSTRPPQLHAAALDGERPEAALVAHQRPSSQAPSELRVDGHEREAAPEIKAPAARETSRDSRPPLPSSRLFKGPPATNHARTAVTTRTRRQANAVDLPVDRESLKQSVLAHVEYTRGKDENSATPFDYFWATACTVRDRLIDRSKRTQRTQANRDPRQIHYLSLEYLLGRTLEESLVNLGLHSAMQEALQDLGLDLSTLAQQEPDISLGNGGLGRLAACLLESTATLAIAATGYGIRYEYGSFEQQLKDNRPIERVDNWLRYGSPWEIQRPETRYLVHFGGRVDVQTDGSGRQIFRWVDTEQVWAVASDFLVPGFGNDVVNTLRLWTAKATKDLHAECSDLEDYFEALDVKTSSERLSRVLYPTTGNGSGPLLRLRQEYFYVSATLQDAVRRHMEQHSSLATLPDAAVFHVNDTAPGLAIVELMRLLLDEYGFGWDEAWTITVRCFAYTNHTIRVDALETWRVAWLETLLPRQLQILYEINRRFLEEVRARFPGDEARVARMSLFSEIPEKRLRVAHLCIIGSSVINGVSELHGRVLRDSIFRDFAELFPQRFTHVTNGVTVRRWLLKSNPALSDLICGQIGEKWITEPHQLRKLQPLSADAQFREAFRRVKRANKERLSDALREVYGIRLDPSGILDVHVKRIHDYKRQILNLLHVVSLYLNYRATGAPTGTPKRTFLFAGKASPGDRQANAIIELIIAVGRTIEQNPRTRDLLAVVFVPNYTVSLAELIVPAADVSEQIALAGTEASGTGCMKLALNGALTVGTPGGANLELAEAVGQKNLFLFGLTASEVEGTLRRGYNPQRIYSTAAEIRSAVDAIARGAFSPAEPGRFAPVVDSLLVEDRFLVLADFLSYRDCHRNVLQVWADPDEWTRRSIMNVCNFGRFASDEVVRNYARELWKVTA